MAPRHVAALPPPELGPQRRAQQGLTGLIVFGPLAALAFAVVRLWGHGLALRDVVLAIVLYALVGHGVTVGFHRLLAHRSFVASRPLRIALAVAGSMAFEGPVIGWVADHRRHHAFTDREGDPHSPHRHGEGFTGQLRGLWHAHMGWLFRHDPTSPERFARDLMADKAIVMTSRLFPLWCVLSLAVPFGIGYLLGGSVTTATTTMLWAGAVRICLLHHVTWSINSICHMFGQRPYATKDYSTNIPALAVLSLGESWHNNHHAFPNSARHGLDKGQRDSSGLIIGWLERLGWAREVSNVSTGRRTARRAPREVPRALARLEQSEQGRLGVEP